MTLYDFLIFFDFDEDDPGQHRYVVANSEEEATEKLETHYRQLEKEGIRYPAFITNPTVEHEGVIA